MTAAAKTAAELARRHQEERIDEALAESFPASDPPYFSLGASPPPEPAPAPPQGEAPPRRSRRERATLPLVAPRGYTFGATAAIVTSVSLIVGLGAASVSRTAIVGGLLIIALADNLTDSLSVHLYQESENLESRSAFRATLTNFGARLLVAGSFVGLVIALPRPLAAAVALAWGVVLLTLLTYALSRARGVPPGREIAKHLAVAVVVIALGRTVGWIIASSVT